MLRSLATCTPPLEGAGGAGFGQQLRGWVSQGRLYPWSKICISIPCLLAGASVAGAWCLWHPKTWGPSPEEEERGPRFPLPSWEQLTVPPAK